MDCFFHLVKKLLQKPVSGDYIFKKSTIEDADFPNLPLGKILPNFRGLDFPNRHVLQYINKCMGSEPCFEIRHAGRTACGAFDA